MGFFDRQEREERERKEREEKDRKERWDKFNAGFGRGPLVGKTGDCFKDDPFFNPWAPGGKFNKK